MDIGKYEFQSEYVKRIAEACKKARAEGFAEGRAEVLAERFGFAVVTILRTRGIAVSDEQEKRILACMEHDLLDRWVRRSVTACSVNELFTD